MGPEVVRKVDKLIANPESHLSCVSAFTNGDHQLVLIVVTGVGDDSVDLLKLKQDVHADGKGVEADGMVEVGQSITAIIFFLEAEHQGKQAAMFWGKQLIESVQRARDVHLSQITAQMLSEGKYDSHHIWQALGCEPHLKGINTAE